MCHSNFPRLNDFGARYRDNGYQLPGREDEESNVIDSPPPFAARAAAGFDVERYDNPPLDAQGNPLRADVNTFRVTGLDLLSAGLLTRNVGYFVVLVPPFAAQPGLADQEGTLEMANVVFSNLGTPWLNVRAGRFEPEYVPFSVKRRLSVAPYEIYELAFPGGAPASQTQSGLEVTGHGGGFAYAVGWVTGSPQDAEDDVPADAYLRLAKVFGAGEGQTAGQRIGLVGHYGRGRGRLDPALPPGSREDFFRVGLDASLNFAHFDLALQGMWAHDAAALWGAADAVNSFGGFGEISFLPRTDLVVFARGDAVLVPEEAAMGDRTRATGGVRYYVWDNSALHVEYSYGQETPNAGGPTQREHTATARVDFGF